MRYILGVGLLFEGGAFNWIRETELQSANLSGNFHGLYQPPHITIKRPFEVSTVDDIKSLQETVADFAHKETSLTIDLELFGSFGKEVVYAKAKDTSKIEAMHKNLIETLKTKNEVPYDDFDGKGFLVHSTIAMELTPAQHSQITKFLNKTNVVKELSSVKLSKIGLFLNVDDAHWIIINEWSMNESEK